MASPDRLPYPFKIIPLEEAVQVKIAKDFIGYPSGLISCNHWGFKLSATATEEEVEDLYNYPLDPEQTWVVTPPKCGTTWTQEMVWLLVNNLDYEGAKTFLRERWTFLESKAIMDKPFLARLMARPKSDDSDVENQKAQTEAPPPARFIKSHLPMSMVNPRLLDVCKVVYVARNPKDACISFYYHNKMIRGHDFTGDPELFVEYFMDGNVVATPVIEHMIEAWNLRHHPNLCFIFYEDMKRDLRSQIRKVAKFFGKSYSDEEVNTLACHLHIDNFKKNPAVNYEELKENGFFSKDKGNFIRKGKTGDWKNHFTPEMTAKFDKWMAKKMKGTDLKFIEDLDNQDNAVTNKS